MLQEKHIPYQYHEVNPYKKEADFLALNPRGLVPTLECPQINPDGTFDKSSRGKPLIESTVISEYLDDAYSDPSKYGPSLFPSDPYQRAWCRIWIDFVGSRVIPSFYRLLQHTAEKPYSVDDARTELLTHLKTFTREMADGAGPWFLGACFGMVDIAIAPWVLRLFLVDHYKPGGLGIPGEGHGGADEAVWARWRRFAAAVADRPSVRETISEPGQYVEAYKRYAEDTTQSQVGSATRGGRGLP